MKVTEKGQITIPKDIRDALGIGAGTEVEFERDNETIVVRKASDRPTRGRQLAERLRGRGDVAMTTSEIMALTRNRDMTYGTLVDSNVLLDIMTEDPVWQKWSATALSEAAETGPLYINPVIYSEVSIRFSTIEALEDALPPEDYRREPIPWTAAFLAGKAFLNYRRNQGTKTTTLPDFFVGAHAAIAERQLLTRDVSRYRTYFPTVPLLTPSD